MKITNNLLLVTLLLGSVAFAGIEELFLADVRNAKDRVGTLAVRLKYKDLLENGEMTALEWVVVCEEQDQMLREVLAQARQQVGRELTHAEHVTICSTWQKEVLPRRAMYQRRAVAEAKIEEYFLSEQLKNDGIDSVTEVAVAHKIERLQKRNKRLSW